MLYNRSNTLKSLEWVIMDEIHYLNDAEVRRSTSMTTFSADRAHLPERFRLGRGIDHAARPRGFNYAQRNGVQRARIR